MRCRRCAGTGDVPIITEVTQFYPDARPLLECCPDCAGSGYQRDEGEALALEEIVPEEEPRRRRARR